MKNFRSFFPFIRLCTTKMFYKFWAAVILKAKRKGFLKKRKRLISVNSCKIETFYGFSSGQIGWVSLFTSYEFYYPSLMLNCIIIKRDCMMVSTRNCMSYKKYLLRRAVDKMFYWNFLKLSTLMFYYYLSFSEIFI